METRVTDPRISVRVGLLNLPIEEWKQKKRVSTWYDSTPLESSY